MKWLRLIYKLEIWRTVSWELWPITANDKLGYSIKGKDVKNFTISENTNNMYSYNIISGVNYGVNARNMYKS